MAFRPIVSSLRPDNGQEELRLTETPSRREAVSGIQTLPNQPLFLSLFTCFSSHFLISRDNEIAPLGYRDKATVRDLLVCMSLF
jgi:hypothetical protein